MRIDAFVLADTSAATRGRIGIDISLIPGVREVDWGGPSKTRVKIVADSADVVDAIRAVPGIEAVEPDQEVHVKVVSSLTTDIRHDVFDQPLDFARWFALRTLPSGRTDPHLKDWWNYPQAAASYNTDSARLGTKVVCIAMDTGVDETHPEINAAKFERIHGAATDLGVHGTLTASIMVGQNIGILPDARILDCKIFDGNGVGTTSGRNDGFDAIIAWMQDTANNGLTDDTLVILNCSFGTYPYVSPNLLIEELQNLGVVVFAAAGNEATNIGTTGIAPASQLEWGAVACTDLSGRMAFFSNYGGNTKIFGWGYQQLCANASDGGYIYPTGSSMSSPYAAACFGSWASGRYRPVDKDAGYSLVEEWCRTWCWTDGVFVEQGQAIGAEQYVPRGASQELALRVVASGLEAIINYGPAPDAVNASGLNVVIKYDISGP